MACILHHKFESAGNSEVGNNPTWGGTPVFTSGGKFGNQLWKPNATNNGDFGVVLTPAQINAGFAISCFWIPESASSAVDYHDLIIMNYGETSFMIAWLPHIGGMYVWLTGASGVGSVYYFTVPAFSANDILHLGFTFDPSLGANQKIALKVDNAACAASIYSAKDSAWTTSSDQTWVLGSAGWSGRTPRCGFDNLKIYDDIKTDFAWDMDNEAIEGSATRRRMQRAC